MVDLGKSIGPHAHIFHRASSWRDWSHTADVEFLNVPHLSDFVGDYPDVAVFAPWQNKKTDHKVFEL